MRRNTKRPTTTTMQHALAQRSNQLTLQQDPDTLMARSTSSHLAGLIGLTPCAHARMLIARTSAGEVGPPCPFSPNRLSTSMAWPLATNDRTALPLLGHHGLAHMHHHAEFLRTGQRVHSPRRTIKLDPHLQPRRDHQAKDLEATELR